MNATKKLLLCLLIVLGCAMIFPVTGNAKKTEEQKALASLKVIKTYKLPGNGDTNATKIYYSKYKKDFVINVYYKNYDENGYYLDTYNEDLYIFNHQPFWMNIPDEATVTVKEIKKNTKKRTKINYNLELLSVDKLFEYEGDFKAQFTFGVDNQNFNITKTIPITYVIKDKNGTPILIDKLLVNGGIPYGEKVKQSISVDTTIVRNVHGCANNIYDYFKDDNWKDLTAEMLCTVRAYSSYSDTMLDLVDYKNY